MITAPISRGALDNWKALFDRFASSMLPNRKRGAEVDAYFKSKYPYKNLKSERVESVVKANIMENECFRKKMTQGAEPEIRVYSVEDAIVGIDITSGYFQVESKDTEKMTAIYDDLFAYRGLDAADLQNYVLVGQYLELQQQNSKDSRP